MTNARNLGDIGRDTNLTEFGEAFTLPTSDGTTGQVLQTNGSGTLTFADAGGGSLELLSVETVTTSVSAVDIDLPAEYSRFRLFLNNIVVGSLFPTYFARISTDGGSTFISSNYNGGSEINWFGGESTNSSSGESLSYFPISPDGTRICAVIDLQNDPDIFVLTAQGICDQNSLAYNRLRAEGIYLSSSKANAIRFQHDGTNTTSGTFALYGYKEAL